MEHIQYKVPKSVINPHTFYYQLLCKVSFYAATYFIEADNCISL